MLETCPQPVSVTPTRHPARSPTKGQRTRDLLAGYVSGYTGQRISGRTLDKIKIIVDAAEANPEQFREIAEEMDRAGSVDRAWRKLHKAQYQMIRP